MATILSICQFGMNTLIHHRTSRDPQELSVRPCCKCSAPAACRCRRGYPGTGGVEGTFAAALVQAALDCRDEAYFLHRWPIAWSTTEVRDG